MEKKTFISARQIRAARALLDWSQEELAVAAGLSIATIRKIETGYISPRDKTMEAIRQALEEAKVEFAPSMGVHLRSNEFYLFEGDDCYLQLMEDIYYTMKGKQGEVLFLYADSSKISETEINAQLRIRKERVKFRFLIEEGNTHMHYPPEEYRWIPKKLFKNNLQVGYGSRVAVCMYEDMSFKRVQKIMIIDSAPLAGALKNTFEFMWENCRKPAFSTAPKVYE